MCNFFIFGIHYHKKRQRNYKLTSFWPEIKLTCNIYTYYVTLSNLQCYSCSTWSYFCEKCIKKFKAIQYILGFHSRDDWYDIQNTCGFHLGFHWVSKLMHVTNLSVSDRLLIHELLMSGEHNALLMYAIGMAVWCWTEYALDTQGTAETM